GTDRRCTCAATSSTRSSARPRIGRVCPTARLRRSIPRFWLSTCPNSLSAAWRRRRRPRTRSRNPRRKSRPWDNAFGLWLAILSYGVDVMRISRSNFLSVLIGGAAALGLATGVAAAEPSAVGLWQKTEDGKPVVWVLVVEHDGV